MTVKSIIDVQLNDAAFNRFAATFEKYQAQTKSFPGVWQQVTKNIDGSRKSFDKLVWQLAAANVQAKLMAKAQAEADRITRTTADRWRDIAKSSKTVATNIKDATVALLKWSAVTSAVGGLLGAGGLWGIDRLALGAAAGRRSSLGLGVPYGEQKAFGVNYGRLVDPQNFLSGVNESLHDVNKRYLLAAAGLTGDFSGKNTGDVANQLLVSLKKLADQTPEAMLVQILKQRGLDQFISLEDFERLKATSPGEFNQLRGSFANDTRAFNVNPKDLKAWADFTTQMGRAGDQIETVLIRGLAGLANPLEHLSASVAKAIGTFLSSDTLKQWIEAAGPALEKFAGFIGSPQFQTDIKDFTDGVGQLATAVKGAVLSIAGIFTKTPNQQHPLDFGHGVYPFLESVKTRFYAGDDRPGAIHDALNNPGNLRPPGSKTGFRQFGSLDEGYRAAARQLVRDEYVHGLNTIRKIISDPVHGWAPASDKNDIPAYLGRLKKSTGYDPDQTLNLRDTKQLATLLAGIVGVEKGHKGYSIPVIIEVLNNSGGSAVVSTSMQAPH